MLPDHPKILSLPVLLGVMEPLRAQGKKIVFTNGCFDLLHPGHADLLQRTKALGDILVLGLNDDASVRRQGKGLDRPINTLQARAFVLAHLASVDYVTSFTEDTPIALIEAIKPHVLVKGGDWQPEQIVGRDVVESCGGQVLSLPLLLGYSTTSIIQKIRNSAPTGGN